MSSMAVTCPFRLFCTANEWKWCVAISWGAYGTAQPDRTLMQRERTNWPTDCRSFELPGRCRARSEGTDDGGRYTGGVAHLWRQLG